MDSIESVEHVLAATVFGRPDDTEADIARYFNPAYTQVTDGHRSDYSDFIAHIKHLRGLVRTGKVQVHEVLRDGRRIADRHTISVTKNDGIAASFEVLLIGELDDEGRVLRVVETTRQLSGDAADADLGHAR